MAEVALERLVERDAGGGDRALKLGHQPGKDLEHP